MSRLYRLLVFLFHPGMDAARRRDMVATFARVIDAAARRGRAAVLREGIAEYTNLLASRCKPDPLSRDRSVPQPASMLGQSVVDLRNACRRLGQRPGYTATVLLVLALGIAINTVVFSVADAALFRGLPYPNGPRIKEIFTADRSGKVSNSGLTPAAFAEWQRHTDVFDGVEGYTYGSFIVSGGPEPDQIGGLYVTSGFFNALAVRPARGRTFVSGEGEPGTDHLVVVSDGLWRRRFGAREDLIGQSIGLNDQTFTVIGIMPPRFRFPSSQHQVWIARSPREEFYGRSLEVIAVLKRNVSPQLTQDRLNAIAAALNVDRPRATGWNVKLMQPRGTLQDKPTERALEVLTAAVIAILLIACANVANLFLAEALGRRRELAIKAALGATRARLIRELLTESVLLGALGGALGLALAWSGLGAVVGLAPPDLTVWTANEIRIDGRILTLTAAMTLITGIVFGSLPAWRASRQEAGDILNARTASAGRATTRLRSALVVIEVALSVLLLTGAALLVRSFLRLHELDPGFKPDGVLTVRLSLPTDRYPAAARRAFLEQVEQKLAAMPGIEAETIADGVPTSGGSLHFQELEAEAGVKETSESILPDASVSPSYFSTMGIPITAGRSFTEDDPATVAIVNDKLARRLWSDGKGIGRRFRLGSTNPWLTVVGIAGDVRGSRMVERETTAEMYSPFWRGIRADSGALRKAVGPRRSFFEALVIVRAAKGLALLDGIKRAVWSIDPSQPVGRAVLVKDLLADSLSQDRFAAALMGTFAALALLLAGAGLYAVLAQLVAHRWREIGIRMALGASAADTSRLIVSRGLLLSGAGVALGLAGAWAAARVLSSQLYGVRPHDPLTFSAVAVAVLTTALAASWVPVRRAVTIDPATVLRVE